MLDPHGAVGYLGLRDYLKKAGDTSTGVFLGTAHPSKFLDVVEEATGKKIELPERLKLIVNKPKISIKSSKNFEDLKQFLLN
jgi:threonine synthase